MNLHEHREEFHALTEIVSRRIGIPSDAVRRDYYIVKMMQQLRNSEFADKCVFKGGTSLSKCYPGSINRFSEDIDLTFIPSEGLSNKQYSRALKQIEHIMTSGFRMDKIPAERNDRNKSSYVRPDNEDYAFCRIKLEIGSSVRPDPYSLRPMKTYIQEYLESEKITAAIRDFCLEPVYIHTLDITRTFLDKVMAVKRHAICGTLHEKVRHIYDVTVLYPRSDIQTFLHDSGQLRSLLILTKETDRFYLSKRNVPASYDPTGPYDFDSWRNHFDSTIRRRYETLHEDLLYTSGKQNFADAIQTFEAISRIFASIGQ